MNVSEAKTVILGICGGVAAYKALEIASQLRQQGMDVHVCMTPAAQEFITPLSFAAVSGNPVLTKPFFPNQHTSSLEEVYPHLYPATRADAFVLVPATANSIAKIAHGFGEDIVSTVALSLPSDCKRFFCPAMNVEMWEQASVQRNVVQLEEDNWKRLGPEAGHLACGMTGYGRLSPPQKIAQEIQMAIEKNGRLKDKHVLILSGPTYEHIDPVRFIGNHSSGKMGKALALAAAKEGATVDFITGPVPEVNVPAHPSIRVHKISQAQEMLEKASPISSSADLCIFAAAVADYTPKHKNHEKLPKTDQDLLLELVPTMDIAATIQKTRKPGQISIGFALQTHNGLERAKEKLTRKNLDAIVLNYADAMGADQGSYTWINKENMELAESWGTLSKEIASQKIIAAASKIL